jgi:hypothetical protein
MNRARPSRLLARDSGASVLTIGRFPPSVGRRALVAKNGVANVREEILRILRPERNAMTPTVP